MEWYEEGFWSIYNHPDTAKQYLEINSQPLDGTQPLNDGMGSKGMYTIEDKHNGSTQKAITLEAFKKMDIDIVIASIPAHVPLFKKLIAQHKPNAKLIVQIGNEFTEILNNLHEIPNLLASVKERPVPASCNAVFYHQPFDTDIFRPSSEAPQRAITSFINCYHDNGGFADFMTLRAMMPEYDFRSYGSQNTDGVVDTTAEMAGLMRQCAFGFHSKRMGDGFGHVLYNFYACGKPVITRLSDYKGKLGEELLEHGVTCFDLDTCSFDEVRDRIVTMPEHEYAYMCQMAYQRFVDTVNYDAEEKKIADFLERLN